MRAHQQKVRPTLTAMYKGSKNSLASPPPRRCWRRRHYQQQLHREKRRTRKSTRPGITQVELQWPLFLEIKQTRIFGRRNGAVSIELTMTRLHAGLATEAGSLKEIVCFSIIKLEDDIVY